MMRFVLADLGVKALYLTYIWLASAVVASLISDRKGYGERPGLITGLLTSAVAIVVWLLWPARPESRWKLQGAIPRRGKPKMTVAEARSHHDTPDGSS
jgi:hypothetical protein